MRVLQSIGSLKRYAAVYAKRQKPRDLEANCSSPFFIGERDLLAEGAGIFVVTHYQPDLRIDRSGHRFETYHPTLSTLSRGGLVDARVY